MIFPCVTPSDWSFRYKLPIVERPCRNCGKVLRADKPFALAEWRGFVSQDHGCDPRYDLTVMVDADPEERLEMKLAFREISRALVGTNEGGGDE